MINKDTKLYGSFSLNAGNKGCEFFNKEFSNHKLNSIYKSFSVKSIKQAVDAALTLNMSGFAVSMPYKKEILTHCNEHSDAVVKIGAANTVINNSGKLFAHNTDYLAIIKFFSTGHYNNINEVFILGNGGYSAAAVFAINKCFNKMVINKITRKDWGKIKNLRNKLVFNCTPLDNIKTHHSNLFIDCLVKSKTGSILSKLQASYQFKLYTGINIIK